MNELPPWLALPIELRARIVKRFKERYPDSQADPRDQEEMRRELAQLAVYRLVNMLDGDIEAAMAHARENAREKGYPFGIVGETKEEWQQAYERCEERLLYLQTVDSRERLMGLRVAELVREQIQIWKAEGKKL